MSPSPPTGPPLRLLVLGGTGFVSGAVAAEALARGHDVTCVARGTGGAQPPAGARLLRADRNAPEGLAPLRGIRFDAAVETATLSLPWVRRALRDVSAEHWTFVSSISVYADTYTPGQTARTARLRPALTDVGTYDPTVDPEPSQATYGGVKLACEQAVREATGDTAFVVRPGLVVGPGDDVGPFGYWPLRMARGRAAAVPAAHGADGLALPAQCVDVRDLAAWIVDRAAARASGVYDAAGPPVPLESLLHEVADAVGHSSLELVPVPEGVLREAGVRPWTGRPSMPLWPPRELYGALSRDVSSSFDAGLRVRPVSETAQAVLSDRLGRGAGTPPVAGLTPVEEASLLRLAGV
ncbi:NAD-dependent dehydratase [Streptomyces venezuelae]|uniref:NAD-dependent dehydratase n=1 Tax=Streptomyces venezuelae TaxID=54571 RepID=A0A5P2C6D2_STRVZ|nr:NAD-dependent epimerase/dehydratase family protein [Streptomyces venezuelae]QES38335.1 NAD-dependent dehydratase [Streptomyces venezuelae]